MLHAGNAELLATKLPANACCMLCRLVTSHSAMEHYLVNLDTTSVWRCGRLDTNDDFSNYKGSDHSRWPVIHGCWTSCLEHSATSQSLSTFRQRLNTWLL